MVQCEMCGTETASPHTVTIEGAELEVCDECADFGTEVRKQGSETTSTKYSTDGSSGSDSTGASAAGSGSSSVTTGSGGGNSRPPDMFDDMDEVVQDYDERIRDARETTGLSQEDLANELNEKASLIRKLEHGSMLPSDAVQTKLERKLDISLTEGGGIEDAEWDSGSASGEYTLGDVVKRKD